MYHGRTVPFSVRWSLLLAATSARCAARGKGAGCVLGTGWQIVALATIPPSRYDGHERSAGKPLQSDTPADAPVSV
uniref:Putative secreted protein n=1 Tax=Anopheles marajoara TaxID=58244 RepID=A0A2M4CCQ4_9DIPT